MSLKARNTLRKIDVVCMREHKDQIGRSLHLRLGFPSASAQQDIVPSEEHEIGALIKLAEYENINIESF